LRSSSCPSAPRIRCSLFWTIRRARKVRRIGRFWASQNNGAVSFAPSGSLATGRERTASRQSPKAGRSRASSTCADAVCCRAGCASSSNHGTLPWSVSKSATNASWLAPDQATSTAICRRRTDSLRSVALGRDVISADADVHDNCDGCTMPQCAHEHSSGSLDNG
jgi:hypothetical protein